MDLLLTLLLDQGRRAQGSSQELVERSILMMGYSIPMSNVNMHGTGEQWAWAVGG